LIQQNVAPTLQANGKAAGSATQQDAESGALVGQAFGGNRTSGPIDVSPALNACGTASGRQDFETEAFLVQSFDVKRGLSPHGSPTLQDLASPLCASDHKDQQLAVCATGDVFYTLRAEGHDASEDGTGRGVGAVACFKGGQGSKAGGIGYSEHIAPTLSACPSGTQLSPTLMQGMQVRRLTPTECERLQGFPDHHARIPWRGKPADECPDGPQYKAYGNSMAVPVMRWIGHRLDQYLKAQQ
jgi:DNA (cytosine-5)-methyltransferase 1